MKLFKAIVNHTGICEGHYFKAGIETLLPESTIKALGDSVKVLGEHIADDAHKAEEVAETETKQVIKPFFDKMIHRGDSETK